MAAIPSLPETIDFEQEGISLRRRQAITDYRQCQDGFPVESRILFKACYNDRPDDDSVVILKVKIQ
jgi:hypothetical protein